MRIKRMVIKENRRTNSWRRLELESISDKRRGCIKFRIYNRQGAIKVSENSRERSEPQKTEGRRARGSERDKERKDGRGSHDPNS
jgi:hypothetical protein